MTGIFLAIPVKRLSASKSRLSPILSLKERQELVRRMLVDVLDAVAQSNMITRTLVVSPDKTILKGIHDPRVEIVKEEGAGGLNMALKSAVNYSMAHEADSLLILPADIPLIQENNVRLIIRSRLDRGLVITPSRDNLGTNALMLTPPDLIPTAFGPNSFYSHLNLAGIRGIPAKTLRIESISLDIDTVKDIKEFLGIEAHSKTRDFLLEIDMVARLRKIQP